MALCSTPSFAWDGNKLLDLCEQKNDGSASYYQDAFAGLGYIAGAADTLNDMSIICTEGLTYGQMRRVVKKYLTNNPELLHRNANILVEDALQKAFPCK